MDQVIFHGRGLHSGERCSVALRRAPGPICFERDGAQASREELELVRLDRGVRVRAPRLDIEIDLVEHVFAALGGLHVQSGIAIEVRGPELPLLDGAALELAHAIRALEPPRAAPRLKVIRAGRIEIDESVYEFEPIDGIRIDVEVVFDAPALGVEKAGWDGTVARFLREIAPARTFGFRREAEMLRAIGRAAHVDPHAVIVLEDDGRAAEGGPLPGELGRHKLLDLIGDLYLYGGPPLGAVFARRPGHAATHAAVREAKQRGLIA